MFKTIKSKLFVIFILISLFILISYLAIAYFAEFQIIKGSGVEEVEKGQKYFSFLKEQDTKMITAALKTFVEDPDFKEIFIEKDRLTLYQKSQPLFKKLKEEFGITHFYFHQLDGYTFLRVHNYDIYGDKVERITFKEAVQTKQTASGIELGKTAFALRVVEPYYLADELIGYVELGQEIDHFNKYIKEKEKIDVAVFVDKKYLDRQDWASTRSVANLKDNWADYGQYLMINTTLAEDDSFDSIKAKCFKEEYVETIKNELEFDFFGSYHQGKAEIGCGAFNLRDASGQKVGAVFVIADFSDINQLAGLVVFVILLIYIISLIISLLIYLFFINKVIVKPIVFLKESVDQITKTKNFRQRVEVRSKDEIGDLSQSFNQMARSLDISYKNIEKKIEERTTHLKKLNKLMIGRELNMIELKEKIKELEENEN